MRQAEVVLKQAAEVERVRQADAMKVRADAELAEIMRLDPSVRSFDDILGSPSGQVFRGLVYSGNSFVEAFKLANFDRLTTAGVAAAAAAAGRQAVSKAHLQAVAKPRGGGALPVPADELVLYRELNPGMSDAEIFDDFNRRAPKRG
jgi:hypothetical protein